MTTPDHIASQIRKKLEFSGLPFQRAVFMAVIKENREHPERYWEPIAVECPAKPSRFEPTHIDMILRANHGPIWMIVECKRILSGTDAWCFIEMPYIAEHAYIKFFYIDTVTKNDRTLHVTASGKKLSSMTDDPFTVYFSCIPTDHKGDTKEDNQQKRQRRGEDDIREALKQVMQGTNGLIEEFSRDPTIMVSNTLGLLPVIVTTAPLYRVSGVADSDDLHSGKIAPEALKASSVPWVFYHHILTPDLKHGLPRSSPSAGRLGVLMTNEYIRTVIIVNAEHWQEFIGRYTGEGWTFQ